MVEVCLLEFYYFINLTLIIMRTKFLMAGIAFACAMFTACNSKTENKPAAPRGEKIGDVFVVKKDNGRFTIVDKDNYDTQADYTEVADADGFIASYSETGVDLMNYAGGVFTHCDSFAVKTLYPVAEGVQETKFIKVWISGGNRLAMDFSKHASLCQVEGKKDDVFPLSNGFVIYEQGGKYGIVKQYSEEPILSAVCAEVSVVGVKDEVYYLVKTSDYTGYIDKEGNGIKPLSSGQYKSAKKAGKVLWSEKDGKVSGLAVAKI